MPKDAFQEFDKAEYGLSGSDVSELERIKFVVDSILAKTLRDTVEPDVHQANDTYVVRTPSNGIAPRVGLRPGKATCKVFKMVQLSFGSSQTQLQPVLMPDGSNYSITVYNLHEVRIEADFISVDMTKFGFWVVDCPCSTPTTSSFSSSTPSSASPSSSGSTSTSGSDSASGSTSDSTSDSGSSSSGSSSSSSFSNVCTPHGDCNWIWQYFGPVTGFDWYFRWWLSSCSTPPAQNPPCECCPPSADGSFSGEVITNNCTVNDPDPNCVPR
mgnify:CR=1 FL=1